MRGGKPFVKFKVSRDWLRGRFCPGLIGWSWKRVGENDRRHREWVLRVAYLVGDSYLGVWGTLNPSNLPIKRAARPKGRS